MSCEPGSRSRSGTRASPCPRPWTPRVRRGCRPDTPGSPRARPDPHVDLRADRGFRGDAGGLLPRTARTCIEHQRHRAENYGYVDSRRRGRHPHRLLPRPRTPPRLRTPRPRRPDRWALRPPRRPGPRPVAAPAWVRHPRQVASASRYHPRVAARSRSVDTRLPTSDNPFSSLTDSSQLRSLS